MFEIGVLISEFCNRSNLIIVGFFLLKKIDIVFDIIYEGVFFIYLKNYKMVEKCFFYVWGISMFVFLFDGVFLKLGLNIRRIFLRIMCIFLKFGI